MAYVALDDPRHLKKAMKTGERPRYTGALNEFTTLTDRVGEPMGTGGRPACVGTRARPGTHTRRMSLRRHGAWPPLCRLAHAYEHALPWSPRRDAMRCNLWRVTYVWVQPMGCELWSELACLLEEVRTHDSGSMHPELGHSIMTRSNGASIRPNSAPCGPPNVAKHTGVSLYLYLSITAGHNTTRLGQRRGQDRHVRPAHEAHRGPRPGGTDCLHRLQRQGQRKGLPGHFRQRGRGAIPGAQRGHALFQGSGAVSAARFLGPNYLKEIHRISIGNP